MRHRRGLVFTALCGLVLAACGSGDTDQQSPTVAPGVVFVTGEVDH